MSAEGAMTRVLITVMTYPHPSEGHKELVCTAGITDSGEWVRLYPIDYRYRQKEQQFHKYQWVEVFLEPRGHGNDRRKESRRPDLETLRIIGAPIPPQKKTWLKRREIVDRLPRMTIAELEAAYKKDATSLGIVRPERVLDIKIEHADREWKPEWQVLFQQMTLFGPPQKPLRKLPFKWSYVFESGGKEYTRMIEDWELGILFLNEAARLGDEEKAAQSVKNKYLNEICAPERDVQFYMGTVFPYNVWIVLGCFYPVKSLSGPQAEQLTLF